MNSKKIFILCIGMPRSGTTWFYEQIKKHKNFCDPASKELHVWDTLDIPHFSGYKSMLKDALLTGSTIRNAPLKQLLKIYNNPSSYFLYFDNLLKNSRKSKTITGDFTPNYWQLSAERFAMIRKNFLENGWDIKVVFFKREPFSRIVSQSITNLVSKRLGHMRWETFAPTEIGNFDSEEIKKNVVESYHLPVEGCPYEDTTRKLQSVFSTKEYFETFYEELFDPQSLQKLSSFLDLPIDLFDPNHIVNRNQSVQLNFTDQEIETIQTFYKACYEYTYSTHPHIKQKWENTVDSYRINS
jgi:hypothetical protein